MRDYKEFGLKKYNIYYVTDYHIIGVKEPKRDRVLYMEQFAYSKRQALQSTMLYAKKNKTFIGYQDIGRDNYRHSYFEAELVK